METKKHMTMKTYEIIGGFMIISGILMAYFMYAAPEMDEQGRITKPGKKFSDLFKKKKRYL
jgi:hypothetical protein